MSDQEVAWLAGLIEGEGSFFVTRKAGTAGPYPVFGFRLNMTDGDVVVRAHALTGIGRLRGPIIPKVEHHKPVWAWAVNRRDDVADLGRLILPWMGARRSTRILEVLEAYESSGRPKWRHGTRTGYENHGCRCDLCRSSNTIRHRELRGQRRPTQ